VSATSVRPGCRNERVCRNFKFHTEQSVTSHRRCPLSHGRHLDAFSPLPPSLHGILSLRLGMRARSLDTTLPHVGLITRTPW
jgi:hypothetical protein